MTKTTVRGLRDGQYTAGTAFLVRKIKALGAKVSVAATGRVTLIDKNGDRHMYVLALDPSVDNSPLTQALADLERLSVGCGAGESCDWCGLHMDACWNRRNGTICPEYHDETETEETAVCQ